MYSQLIICILVIALLLITLRLLIIERKLRRIQPIYQHLKHLINSIPELTWVKDTQSRFLFVNNQFSKAFVLPVKDIIGKTDFDLCSDPEQAQAYVEDDLKTLTDGKIIHCEEAITAIDRTPGWSETIKVPIFDEHKQIIGTAGMARDISQRKEIEHKLSHLAYHDHLTDLPNRIYFVKHINKLLNLNNCAVAIIVFDLNNFKNINDSLGHSSGDDTLIQIAERLKLLIDDNTVIARLSGDEFIIAHNYSKLENSFEKLQAALLQQFEQPIILKSVNYKLSASFGIAVAPRDGKNYETLLKNADLAMHQSKANNHKHCVYFVQKFADELLYKMNISNQLHQGINKQQFSLVYQPKINTTSNTLIGMESLLRWQLDDKQWVSPSDFIPIAEKNGFIIELGNWVIKSVLEQIKNWLDNGIKVVPVSINVSAVQLAQPHFVSYLLQQLERYQIPGNLLEIELTEGVLMENIDTTITLLKQIRKKDILISIDDFGTGYSSLSYLPLLPIDTLKIDRAFISDLHLNTGNQKIIQSIVSLAQNFNLAVIAEGVENEQELAETGRCGINNIQGYYYSRPLAVSELETKWLKKTNSIKINLAS